MTNKNQKVMYNLQKNNYHQKPKSSTIYTPKEVSEFIFELLKDKIPNNKTIFDPCCGQGSLLTP
jgi:type I restriction-modification system DNA methylase subunit